MAISVPAIILPAGARKQIRNCDVVDNNMMANWIYGFYSRFRRRHLVFHQFYFRNLRYADNFRVTRNRHTAHTTSPYTHLGMRLRHFVISFDFATCIRNPSECLYIVIVFDWFELRGICIRLRVADAGWLTRIAYELQHDSAIRILKMLRGILAEILLEICTTTANCCDCIMIWLHMKWQWKGLGSSIYNTAAEHVLSTSDNRQ